MAGITTSYTIPQFKQPISLSSYFNSNLTAHKRIDYPISTVARGITCRYGGGGGGGGYSRQGASRKPKSNDDDPALDIASIRYLLLLFQDFV